MAKDNHENTAKKRPYESSGIDLKFLRAIDYVIEKNKAANVKPNTDNAISKTLFGDRTIIGKIRVSKRGITMAQLGKFAIYFNLDFNYFFRDTESIVYNPQAAGGNQRADIMAHNIGNITGDKMKGTIYMGDVHKEGDIKKESTPHQTSIAQQDQDKENVVGFYQAKLSEMRKELDQAREEQRDISKKYITLLEQKIGT